MLVKGILLKDLSEMNTKKNSLFCKKQSFKFCFFSSLAEHVGWPLKLFKKAVLIERYIPSRLMLTKVFDRDFLERSLFSRMNIMLNIISFFPQVDVGALGTSAIEMDEVCLIH